MSAFKLKAVLPCRPLASPRHSMFGDIAQRISQMKNVLVLLITIAALGISSAQAGDYVCQATYIPPSSNPTLGMYGAVVFNTVASNTCVGSALQHFLCSKSSTSTLCGADAQYSEASMISFNEMLRSAEAVHQPVWAQSDLCNGGGNNWSCTSTVMFLPTP
jgi:hypothetical protein